MWIKSAEFHRIVLNVFTFKQMCTQIKKVCKCVQLVLKFDLSIHLNADEADLVLLI